MQKAQWQAIAIGAGLAAVVVAIATGRLPRWMRVTLVLGTDFTHIAISCTR